MSIIDQITASFNTPWKAVNELRCWMSFPYVRLLFAFYRIEWKPGLRFYGAPIIQKHRLSKMSIGPRMQLRSLVRTNPLGPNHPVILATWQENAILSIGDNFGMTGGAICAAECIDIGDNVLVGANTTIVDTDFHPIDPELRRDASAAAASAPVRIERDVFIGMNCMILKGSTIGQGSVIGAGSTVTGRIPPCSLAVGNPARVIRQIGPLEKGLRELHGLPQFSDINIR
jgi:acetyltransferase-like isoleucine patch superfamily enzyme